MSFAGPQVYAYAGGRPLVHTDPMGRKIVTQGLHSTCLANLKSNQAIGRRIQAMDDANDVIFDVSEVPPSDGMVADGGGQTYIWPYAEQPGEPIDCDKQVTTIRININTPINQRLATDLGIWPSGIFEVDQEALLAHEFGHAEYLWKNCLDGQRCGQKDSWQQAVDFEDAVRGWYGLPLRGHH